MKASQLLLSLLLAPLIAHAATTINATNADAYGADVGWVNWRGDVTSGAVVGEYFCSGFIYSANCGWINLGSGGPANGIRYQNDSATNFGVNMMSDGALRGFAYGANIGWINFEALGNPRVDFKTGRFTGFAYGANVGWINLGDALGHPVTDSITPGADGDGDGIADAWELERAGNLTKLGATTDYDGDGLSDLAEYLADSNPFDSTDLLRITMFDPHGNGTLVSLTWTSQLSRCYFIEYRNDLVAGTWLDSGLGAIPPDGLTTARGFAGPGATRRFYRIRAIRPLAP